MMGRDTFRAANASAVLLSGSPWTACRLMESSDPATRSPSA